MGNELTRQLLRGFELVREPLRKVGSNRVALGREERDVLGGLVDQRARRRREPADRGAERLDLRSVALRLLVGDGHLHVQDLVDRLAPSFADVGNRVMGAGGVINHIGVAAVAIAATSEPSRLARRSRAVVHRACSA